MASTIQPFTCDAYGSEIAREWTKWKRNFGHFVDFNGIHDSERKTKLLLLMAGTQVQEVLENLNDDAETAGPRAGGYGVLDPFQATMGKLDEYFAATINITVERHLFNQMKQEHGEKMDKFVMRLRTQAKRCDFEGQMNSCIRDRMITGCTSDEFRREMLKKANASLDEVVAQAKVLEAVEVQSKAFRQGPYDSAAVNRIVENNKCGRCGRPSHKDKDDCLALSKTCFQCGKSGHFRTQCRTAGNKNSEQRKQKGYRRFQPYRHNNGYGNNRASNNSQERDQQQKSDTKAVKDEANTNDINWVQSPDDKGYVFCITDSETNRAKCSIGGVNIECVIDSGSKHNIIDMESWEALKAQKVSVIRMSKETDQSFTAYGDNPFAVMGMVDAELVIGKQKDIARFYVVRQKGLPLLGMDSAMKFGILHFNKPLEVYNIKANQPFNKIRGIQIELPIDPRVTPVWQPYRRVPVPLERAVDEKIEELLTIEPVNGHTGWVSPVVVVMKDKTEGKSEVRLCIDMRRANKAILRENHPLPVINDFLPHINGATVFSKLDIREAFHQVELAEQSRHITAFITRKGLYQYKRLMFGISCAPEMFQKILERILAGLAGCFNMADDIIIVGKTAEEHDQRLQNVMKRLEEYDIVLNRDKCVFRATQIKFLGHILNAEGISPSQDKIDAILKFSPPTSPEQVRSFLGMVNFLGQYIPDLATMTDELRALLKKDVPFEWGQRQQKAFDELKLHLTSDVVLGYYDVNDQTMLIVDASPVGLGAVLIQIARSGPKKGKPRVITYASKSLSEAEKRYCQTEKEALALVWGVEHNHFYLYGRCFDLITDHKPLEVIFGPNSRPCARIERWVMRLQSYKYNIIYRAGKSNIADPLSRLCQPGDASFDEKSEHYVNFITRYAVPKSFKLEEISAASKFDKEILEVKKALNSNRSDHSKWLTLLEMDRKNITYRMNAIEFSFAGDILLRSSRIVMPHDLRKRTLELAHEGHPGMTEMKKRLQSKIWTVMWNER